jgi:hypothetical protein
MQTAGRYGSLDLPRGQLLDAYTCAPLNRGKLAHHGVGLLRATELAAVEHATHLGRRQLFGQGGAHHGLADLSSAQWSQDLELRQWEGLRDLERQAGPGLQCDPAAGEQYGRRQLQSHQARLHLIQHFGRQGLADLELLQQGARCPLGSVDERLQSCRYLQKTGPVDA